MGGTGVAVGGAGVAVAVGGGAAQAETVKTQMRPSVVESMRLLGINPSFLVDGASPRSPRNKNTPKLSAGGIFVFSRQGRHAPRSATCPGVVIKTDYAN
jgi:hypothetical protein